ncbi:MAG: glycogen synthase [Chloroflexota bacterium]
MKKSNQKKTLKVMFLASEAAPLVKVGGLGDVAGSLPPALRQLQSPLWEGPQLDVRLVLPFHEEIKLKVREPHFVASFLVDHPGEDLPAKAFLTDVNGLPVYLIDGPPILPDMPVYSSDAALDGEKYVFFSLAVLEMIKHMDWQPDIIHANDWHTATSLYALSIRQKNQPEWQNIRKILTIHNLPFMGKDAEEALIKYGIPRAKDKRLPKWATLFPLPLGLLAADRIVAVSPGYAKEILTPEFGCGLQDFLKTRQSSILGILNGLDQEAWNPQTDPALIERYSPETIDRRTINKKTLQEDLNLPVEASTPLLIVISRLDQQKGIDIAIAGLRQMAEQRWQLVLLGTGDPLLESDCRSLEAEFPDRVRAIIRFDAGFARRMYASGDILLMPSRYEPCGLAQMIAMRYGCVPLARATGGLKDTIRDDVNPSRSTGFLFEQTSPEAFIESLNRALRVYSDSEIWRIIQLNGMRQDFSWEKSALQYAKIYLELTEQSR